MARFDLDHGGVIVGLRSYCGVDIRVGRLPRCPMAAPSLEKAFCAGWHQSSARDDFANDKTPIDSGLMLQPRMKTSSPSIRPARRRVARRNPWAARRKTVRPDRRPPAADRFD